MSLPIVPLLIAGGAGTRLWPLSRPERPKQFLRLFDGESSFVETLRRVGDSSGFAPPIVVAREIHIDFVRDGLARAGMTADIIVEPVGRGTGPAVLAGARWLARRAPDAVALALATDHRIDDPAAFVASCRRALPAARAGHIVAFGIRPLEPSGAFGYIRPGPALPEGAEVIAQFVEKPHPTRAAAFVEDGWLWNSGNFLFRAEGLAATYGALDPATHAAVDAALDGAAIRDGVTILGPEFAGCQENSIDVAVMEKTDRAAVVRARHGWTDIGGWAGLWRAAPRDGRENAASGDVRFENAGRNLVIGDERPVKVVGVSDLAVVVTDDSVLVTSRREHGAAEPAASLREEGWGVREIEIPVGAEMGATTGTAAGVAWLFIVRGRGCLRGDGGDLDLGPGEAIRVGRSPGDTIVNLGAIPLAMLEVRIAAT